MTDQIKVRAAKGFKKERDRAKNDGQVFDEGKVSRMRQTLWVPNQFVVRRKPLGEDMMFRVPIDVEKSLDGEEKKGRRAGGMRREEANGPGFLR